MATSVISTSAQMAYGREKARPK
ncbi:hypothetical protein CCACVL1_22670 [Corchorus capsularis]|uniref:Uncharacterized protein n=1 Tax=Corchorus capsularis TaxID=210143 RepID=A0A1R3GXI4_COCAP|nr:hypothetical protein CCACVL1_22670 [Corchorus capsularis]